MRVRPPALLLVEDDLDLQEAISQVAADLGCIVEVAATGAEGARAVSARFFDVIVLEMSGDEVDGWEVLDALEASGAATPLIGLSAWEPWAGGRFRYWLDKPLDIEALTRALVDGLRAPEPARTEGDAASGALP